MKVWLQIVDTTGAVLVFMGAAICLLGVIGMLRLRSGMDLATLALIGFFQLMTGPVAAHLVARSAYRTGQIDHGELLFDELDAQLTEER